MEKLKLYAIILIDSNGNPHSVLKDKKTDKPYVSTEALSLAIQRDGIPASFYKINGVTYGSKLVEFSHTGEVTNQTFFNEVRKEK